MQYTYDEKIASLIDDGHPDEAYALLTNKYENDPSDINSLFGRAIIGIYLPDYYLQSIEDLEYIVSLDANDYTFSCYCLLSKLYCFAEIWKNSIYYGELALNFNEEHPCDDEQIEELEEAKGFLAIAYLKQEDEDYYERALKLLNEAIDYIKTSIFYDIKVQLLVQMNRIDEAKQVTQKFGDDFDSINYYKRMLGHISKRIAETGDDDIIMKVYAEDALKHYKESLNDEDNPHMILEILDKMFECYLMTDNFKEAIEILDKYEWAFNEHTYVEKKVRLLELDNRIDEAITIIQSHLDEKPDWFYYYYTAYFINKTSKDYNLCLELLIKAYNENPLIPIASAIYDAGRKAKKYKEALFYLKESIKRYPNEGVLYYLAAKLAAYANESFDEMDYYYTKAFELGYLDYTTMYLNYPTIGKDPTKYNRFKDQVLNIPMDKLPGPALEQLGKYYFYGLGGLRVNLSFAKKYLTKALDDTTNASCIYTSLARIAFKEEKYGEGYDLLQKGIEALDPTSDEVCDCCDGTLIYYIVKTGEQEEYLKILKIFLFHMRKMEQHSNITIYMYAYCALKGEKGFSLNKALKLLKYNYPFVRYELTRYMMLKLVLNRLGKDTKKIDKLIKECLPFYKKDGKMYYEENKDKDLILPFEGDF